MATLDKSALTRRKSYGIVKLEDTNVTEGFPRRHSLGTKPATGVLVRRHSEITLPEIQTVKKIDAWKKSKLCRQFSMINAPKILTERPSNKKENFKVDTDEKVSNGDLTLPRIPSVTPEPEEVRQMSQHTDHSTTLESRFADGSYRPKHCWCLRCQLMYAMFKAGDDRLDMWGNYPCFKR